jgi:hypothetical protein
MGKLDGTESLLTPASNHPVERTAHSAGFVAVPGASGCGPPLTGSVRRPLQLESTCLLGNLR